MGSRLIINDDVLFALQSIPDNSIDLVFADPPFNIGKKYSSGIDDSLEDNEYIEWCRKWIELAITKLKTGGTFFLFNTPKNNIILGNILNKHLNFKHWIAVQIKQSMPIKGQLYPSHYSLLYYTKDKPNTFSPPRISLEICRRCNKEIKDYGGHKSKLNPNGLNIEDVWTDIFPVRHKDKKKREANQLSLKLVDRCIDIATKEGDTVLDLFGGTGTVAIVSELRNRNWIHIDNGDHDILKDRLINLEDEIN